VGLVLNSWDVRDRSKTRFREGEGRASCVQLISTFLSFRNTNISFYETYRWQNPMLKWIKKYLLNADKALKLEKITYEKA